MYPQQKRRKHFADLTNAITHAKHAEVHRLATEGIINLLHDRSRALAFTCNFEEAENESRQIIARAPQLAVGYLSLGDNLQAQGKYAAAIRIYETGLTNAISESDSYAQLEKAKAMSVVKDAYRFDIITSATIEIAYNIFSMLDQTTRCICLNVCQKWRGILFSSPKAWHRVVFDKGMSSFLNSIPIFGRVLAPGAVIDAKE
ncbi:hypothetical protein BJV82DRAFT_579351 [Fennellomyces sp. T-0311]|nr:hypothetical protein BJV82DRAFT_579351 [Fennellomyces sp. T-0311]